MSRGSSIYNRDRTTSDEAIVAPYLQEVQSMLNRSLRPDTSTSNFSSIPSVESRLQLSRIGPSAPKTRKPRPSPHLSSLGQHTKLNGHAEVAEDVKVKYDVEVQVNPRTYESYAQCEPVLPTDPNVEVNVEQRKADYDDVLEDNFRLKRIIDDLQYRLDEGAIEGTKDVREQGSYRRDVASQCDAEEPVQLMTSETVKFIHSQDASSAMARAEADKLKAVLAGHECRVKLLEDVKACEIGNAKAVLRSILLGHQRRRQFLQALNV